MGTVYLAEDKWDNNATRVVKQLLKRQSSEPAENQESIRLFEREAQILKNLDHPLIVKVHDFHVDVEDQRYFLVMDYVPGHNLEIIINTNGPFSSELVVRIGIHCADVLDYLHNQPEPIIYRDLKPSNLMLTPDGRIIFIDFGIARQFIPKEIATRVVTAGYSPPEQYFGKPETRSDIYSLGATMSHLLTGVRPKPLTGSNPASINPEVLPSLNSLIRKMTSHEVDDRPASAQAVRYALYKIYKELHPEFEIPDEPDHLLYDERAQAEQAARLKYGTRGAPNPRRVVSHNLVPALKNGSHRSNLDMQTDSQTDVLSTFVERVKKLLWLKKDP
jgi:eukaryotic-like serine/threonine-protein kinase